MARASELKIEGVGQRIVKASAKEESSKEMSDEDDRRDGIMI